MPLARGSIALQTALQAALVATLAVAAAAAAPDGVLPRMERLSKEYKSRELVAEFGDETFAGWPDAAAGKALQMRAQAHRALTNGARAGRGVKWGDSGTGGGMEHMIVERDDGTLWMPMRIDDGLAEATSADGGKTWTAPVRSAIDGPGSRFHVRRLRSGRLPLVSHVGFPKDAPALARRTNLTALVSDDEGRTWPHRLLLDDREQVSYPDAVETSDGKLSIIYDRGRASDREIPLANIVESDIRAGTPGPSARLRLPVDKATGPR